jgi:hypothetical protein
LAKAPFPKMVVSNSDPMKYHKITIELALPSIFSYSGSSFIKSAHIHNPYPHQSIRIRYFIILALNNFYLDWNLAILPDYFHRLSCEAMKRCKMFHVLEFDLWWLLPKFISLYGSVCLIAKIVFSEVKAGVCSPIFFPQKYLKTIAV